MNRVNTKGTRNRYHYYRYNAHRTIRFPNIELF
jgi:hypothetical protein